MFFFVCRVSLGLQILNVFQLGDMTEDVKEEKSLEKNQNEIISLEKLSVLESRIFYVYLAHAFFLPSHVHTFSDRHDIVVDQDLDLNEKAH